MPNWSPGFIASAWLCMGKPGIFHVSRLEALHWMVPAKIYIPLYNMRHIGYSYLPFPITKTSLFKYTENFTIKKWKKKSDKNSYIFQISAQNIDCGYSLEPPRRGGSNEYPQPMFLSRNKKNNLYYSTPHLPIAWRSGSRFEISFSEIMRELAHYLSDNSLFIVHASSPLIFAVNKHY